MQEKVSVIVPIFKVEKYLDRCISSILNQTYKNLEIILVDDGSPDNCPKLCDEYARQDKRVRVIHKENGGLSDARNAGIDIATGDFLTFIDSDDCVSNFFVEKLLNLSKSNNAEIVSCGIQRFKENIAVEQNEISISQYTKKEALINTFRSTDYEFIVAWGKLYKKELFETIRYPLGKIHEDEFICHRLFNKTNNLVVTSEKLYFYFINSESITGVGYKLKRINYLEALEDRVRFFKEKYIDLYADMAMHFAYQCINVYFEIPANFPQKKQAKKLTRQIFKRAKKLIKGIKTSSRKRFFIFTISPRIYKRIFL